jgi:ankyrin repeat protein
MAGHNRLECVKLIAGRVDLNERDNFERTPLFLAAGAGAFEVVKYMLERPGIAVNARAKDVSFWVRNQLR